MDQDKLANLLACISGDLDRCLGYCDELEEIAATTDNPDPDVIAIMNDLESLIDVAKRRLLPEIARLIG